MCDTGCSISSLRVFRMHYAPQAGAPSTSCRPRSATCSLRYHAACVTSAHKYHVINHFFTPRQHQGCKMRQYQHANVQYSQVRVLVHPKPANPHHGHSVTAASEAISRHHRRSRLMPARPPTHTLPSMNVSCVCARATCEPCLAMSLVLHSDVPSPHSRMTQCTLGALPSNKAPNNHHQRHCLSVPPS